jgi:hypothetical protein
MDQETADRLVVRDLVENWAIWRDVGDWERFRTVWHDGHRTKRAPISYLRVADM